MLREITAIVIGSSIGVSFFAVSLYSYGPALALFGIHQAWDRTVGRSLEALVISQDTSKKQIILNVETPFGPTTTPFKLVPLLVTYDDQTEWYSTEFQFRGDTLIARPSKKEQAMQLPAGTLMSILIDPGPSFRASVIAVKRRTGV